MLEDDDVPEIAAPVDDAEAPAPEQEAEPQAEGAEAPTEPAQKPNRGDRRFAHLTARASAEAARADQAERRAQELQQLLEARNNGQETPSPTAGSNDVERRAAELVANRALDERRVSLINEGVRAFGQTEWQEKTDFLANMGAFRNPAFMRAVVQAPGGEKVVAALADDADRLAELLKMEPVDMAVEMGRLSAEVSGSTGRRVSQAPAPAKNLTARATPAAPNIYDTGSMSMKEYAALRQKQAPRHLGGRAGR